MSTNKVSFTAGRVSQFTCEAGKPASFLWDSVTSGLGLKASAGGAKSYVLQSRLASGASVRLTIGSATVWSLSKARDEARRLQTMIDQGIDPRQAKRDSIAEAAAKVAEADAARLEAARVATPALDAWQRYVEARRPKWSDRHLLEHERVVAEGGESRTQGRRPGESDKTLPGILRPLLLLPLEQIDADRVRLWLKDEATHRPTYARLAFSLLRAFLNWCSDRPEYRD